MPIAPLATAVPGTVVPFVVSMTVIAFASIDEGSRPGAIVASTVVVSATLMALFAGSVDATCGGWATTTRSPTLTTAFEAGAEECVYGAPSPSAAMRGTSVNGAAGAAGTGMLKMPERRERSVTPRPGVETRAFPAATPLPTRTMPRANAMGAFDASNT